MVSLSYSVGTYPGADDIVAVTAASVSTGDGALPTTALYLNTDGEEVVVVVVFGGRGSGRVGWGVGGGNARVHHIHA